MLKTCRGWRVRTRVVMDDGGAAGACMRRWGFERMRGGVAAGCVCFCDTDPGAQKLHGASLQLELRSYVRDPGRAIAGSRTRQFGFDNWPASRHAQLITTASSFKVGQLRFRDVVLASRRAAPVQERAAEVGCCRIPSRRQLRPVCLFATPDVAVGVHRPQATRVCQADFTRETSPIEP